MKIKLQKVKENKSQPTKKLGKSKSLQEQSSPKDESGYDKILNSICA